ncbi:helix-turn-helix domain-containing protein [Sphingobacterium siyangense]|uniref:Helicase-like protein n=1 Tax=Sphingobacterium siyangense TaxID=459529 RepID=A0A562MJY8_9SPHI|nr:helix-turn-helix domain-containing protein [Sphingobacterium siyangense]TWI20229.1 helicase-like protein [Sphingobacterium siyangense]UQA74780.1 helix-turn-helix domain-containing protein [Sphingobacterium siyangense]
MSNFQVDRENTAFMQAVAFVNQTNQNIFITGKAGTGKTTFLKYIREHSYKKMAITAPTGVAAMNAGGTTLHSLFWLPFGTFIEDYELRWDEQDSHIYNKSRLFSTIKLTKQRRAILQELELLVIDEVSMVRADTLDAINVILQSVRRDMRPFGGLQVLFIGDLYQLPPVVKDAEWNVLRDHYSSVFFFNAKILRDNPLVMLELNKIYRQQDEGFISILNAIRNNQCTSDMLTTLNGYYQQDFVPNEEEQYITLTSHNRNADEINGAKLASLSGKMLNLKAVVKDDFAQGSYPAEETLSLKIGAQVMFIRNDSGDERKYYNGKIGTVKDIDTVQGTVTVTFPDGSESVTVKRETWENIRYNYDKGQDQIKEEILGTFSQFPLRLAWAITIHKSQGLTFQKAIIDAGTSFAAGQVYVALSRLTSLDGLVLKSIIPSYAIRTDYQVVEFAQRAQGQVDVNEILEQCQRNYLGQILMHGFRWDGLLAETSELLKSLEERNIDGKEQAVLFFQQLVKHLQTQEKVAHKFIVVLYDLLRDKNAIDYDVICERSTAAVNWFLPKMDVDLIEALTKHIEEYQIRKRTKKYIDELKALLLDYKRKREQLQHCLLIAETLSKREDFQTAMLDVAASVKTKEKDELAAQSADEEGPKKLDTKEISLEMFKDGMSIADIAVKRGMVAGTIYGHLINFVGTEVEATELIEQDKLDRILGVIRANPDKSSSELKMLLGADIDYPDIKIGQKVLGL